MLQSTPETADALADLGFFLEGVTLGTRASEALRGSGFTGE